MWRPGARVPARVIDSVAGRLAFRLVHGVVSTHKEPEKHLCLQGRRSLCGLIPEAATPARVPAPLFIVTGLCHRSPTSTRRPAALAHRPSPIRGISAGPRESAERGQPEQRQAVRPGYSLTRNAGRASDHGVDSWRRLAASARPSDGLTGTRLRALSGSDARGSPDRSGGGGARRPGDTHPPRRARGGGCLASALARHLRARIAADDVETPPVRGSNRDNRAPPTKQRLRCKPLGRGTSVGGGAAEDALQARADESSTEDHRPQRRLAPVPPGAVWAHGSTASSGPERHRSPGQLHSPTACRPHLAGHFGGCARNAEGARRAHRSGRPREGRLVGDHRR